MALFDFTQPSSVDSDHPMSHLSSHSASSVSLASTITSSDSDDYYSCINEMATDESLPEETLFNEADLEELNIPLEAEADDQPSTILIYSIATSPIASLNPSPCPLTPLSFISPLTVEQAIQSGEHDFLRPSRGTTIVVWDPRLPGNFQPESHTSTLPPWWRSDECLGTFGFPAYKQLQDPVLYASRFAMGDPQSDDMEGRDVWDLTAPETLPECMWRVNLVRRRRGTIISGDTDRDFLATL